MGITWATCNHYGYLTAHPLCFAEHRGGKYIETKPTSWRRTLTPWRRPQMGDPDVPWQNADAGKWGGLSSLSRLEPEHVSMEEALPTRGCGLIQMDHGQQKSSSGFALSRPPSCKFNEENDHQWLWGSPGFRPSGVARLAAGADQSHLGRWRSNCSWPHQPKSCGTAIPNKIEH